MMLLKDKFYLCSCPNGCSGCRVLKEECNNWTFFVLYRGFHFLNISGIKFLFDFG